MEIGQELHIKCIESNAGCKGCVLSKDNSSLGIVDKTTCRVACTPAERPDKKYVIFINADDKGE